MIRFIKKNKYLSIGVLLLLCFLIVSIIIYSGRHRSSEKTQETVYSTLSTADQETADLYAELYETSAEEVAKIQEETGDWEQTGKRLEKEFFTIPENTKYQMAKEGYSIEDLEEAERLSARTGRKAMELIQAKGKTSDKKSWSDVVKDNEILSAEEQLGLSKEQIQQLEKKSLEKEERMEAALLILNGKYNFDEIIKALNDGQTIQQLKEQDSK